MEFSQFRWGVRTRYLSLLHCSVDVFVLLELLQLSLDQNLPDVHHLLHGQGQTLHREAEFLLQRHTSFLTLVLLVFTSTGTQTTESTSTIFFYQNCSQRFSVLGVLPVWEVSFPTVKLLLS